MMTKAKIVIGRAEQRNWSSTECKSKGWGWKFPFSTSLLWDELQCTVYKCNVLQVASCNTMYLSIQDPSLPSWSDILRYIWTCRASAIYDIPINWRYIHKRCPALVDMPFGLCMWWVELPFCLKTETNTKTKTRCQVQKKILFLGQNCDSRNSTMVF